MIFNESGSTVKLRLSLKISQVAVTVTGPALGKYIEKEARPVVVTIDKDSVKESDVKTTVFGDKK